MMTLRPDVEERLAELRASYCRALEEKLGPLVKAVAAGPRGDIETVFHEAHRLYGTVGTYGFVEVSQSLSEIVELTRAAAKGEKNLGAEEWERVRGALERAVGASRKLAGK